MMDLELPGTLGASRVGRGVYCNRTLNLRSIRAIGYDMDYTLVHYHVDEWERRAFEHVRSRLADMGWPVDALAFDPAMAIRGLVIDTELGNVLKANRFGFVKKVLHGTRPLDFDAQRAAYARTIVDLAEPRWVFLNTLFSISEACIYMQLVELLDAGRIPTVLGYRELYGRVKACLDATHMEGRLKAEIIEAPDRFVMLDPDVPLTLLDQRHAGKKLLLITNSEWDYTEAMMRHAFDRFLPPSSTWRDMFDVVIVGARKPDFFVGSYPMFEVATEHGLLRPGVAALRTGSVYFGGSAREVERHLGLSGDEILYVGDHMFGDVHFTKNVLRWRTALILRELEGDIVAVAAAHALERELTTRMAEKERLEEIVSRARVALLRLRYRYGPPVTEDEATLTERVTTTRSRLLQIDAALAPMARAITELSNPTWGLITRAGNDKSHLARQVERYADIYTSRVSNLLAVTPFEYLRSRRGDMPHDPWT